MPKDVLLKTWYTAVAAGTDTVLTSHLGSDGV
jgi:hypothetical protein